jgi:integrase
MSGVWTKPGATTKRKTTHRVPLSAPARQLLVDIRKDAEQTVQQSGGNGDCPEFVFPGNGRRGHREEIKHQWSELCKTAGLLVRAVKTDDQGREFVEYKSSARLHDLRHTYASVLASSGLSLPIIGALLGHTQPATSARYAHLLDDPLRDATERASAIIEGRSQAEIIKLKKVNS